MTEKEIEIIARYLCSAAGFDPDKVGLQYGDQGILRHTEIGWKPFAKSAVEIIDLVDAMQPNRP